MVQPIAPPPIFQSVRICECGCGQPTFVAWRSDKRGYVRGQPLRFIKGHNNRLRVAGANPRWLETEASYDALHDWLRKTFPKTGICENCNRDVGAVGQAGTHYAFRFHGLKPYSRVRTDYQELCPACHKKFDTQGRL